MTARSLAAALVLAVIAAPAPAQISSEKKFLNPFKSVVAKASDSTVWIRSKNNEDLALGTVVYEDGYILTKASELHGPVYVRLNDGSELEASVIGKHKPTDLALLHVDAIDLKPVTFADSTSATTGNWLVAALPSKNLPAKYEGISVGGVGIVSVKTRKLTGADAEIYNHNKGFMGILLDKTDPKDADGKVIGAKVIEVSGAAKKAGLKENDVIIAVDDLKVAGREALQDSLDNSRPDDSVTVTILREKEEKKVTVKLGGEQLTKGRGDLQNSMGSELSGRRTGFPSVLQTDMVVETKNCGGPIVDLDGKVLGISIARAGRVETWVLPGESIRPLLGDLRAGKFAPPTSAIKSTKSP